MRKENDKSTPGFIKRLIFKIIFICIPLIIILFLECLLRLFGYGDNLNLLIDNPDPEFREYKIVNPQTGKKYFQKLEYTFPANDMFLKGKQENTFRIFVLGSSTAIGFPYGKNLMFSRILHERLRESYTGKNIEVINTAITAINSYTLLDYMDDVLKAEPDALIIYCGHNEYYGAFGIASNEIISRHRLLVFIHLDLLSMRFYQLLRNVFNKTSALFNAKNSEPAERGTLMKRIAAKKEIAYKDEIYTQGIAQFKKNMEGLLKKARRNDLPVFISDLVCNVRDLPPFCSTVETGYPSAEDIYYMAKKYENEKEYTAAKEYYYKSKDLDCIRFRAPEEINVIIYELAEKYDAYLVPVKDCFEDNSVNGIIGSKLVTEHVHPNIDGYFLMADAFCKEITSSNLIRGKCSPVINDSYTKFKRYWGYTGLDSIIGVYRINSLKSSWPFKPLNTASPDNIQIIDPSSLESSLAYMVLTSPEMDVVDAHIRLGRYYKENNNFFKAFKEYNSIIKFDPCKIDYYAEAAECLIKLKDLPAALRLIDRQLELKETFTGYLKKGEILLLMKDYESAVILLNTASGLYENSDRKELLSLQIEALIFNGDIGKAKALLKELKSIGEDYNKILQLENLIQAQNHQK